jgi:hypothetical protein
MAYRGLPEDLLQAVDPQELRSYALAKGWQRAGNVDGRFSVLSHPGSDLDQVLAPLNVYAPDYGRRIGDAVQVLSEKESRPALEVLNDLLQADADVLRFRVVSPEAVRGMLPLEEAVDLMEGAKQALLAAACSVIAPGRSYHPRLSRAEAGEMLKSCRMSQTERGSFTLAIACPVRAVEASAPGDSGEPFVRRTTRVVMGFAQRLVSAIEGDDLGSLVQGSSHEPVLSSNFCEALLRMQPPQDRSCLSLSCTWASGLPLPSDSMAPSAVTFRREHFPAIEALSRKLQPAEEPRPDLFVGYVDALNGEMGQDGRMQGEVTLLLLHEETPIRARVNLSPDQYEMANAAHMAGGVLAARGVLHRGRRIHRLSDVTSLQRVEGGPSSR